MSGNREHPAFVAFFDAAYKKIGPAMRSMTDDPLSRPLKREEISIALAMACMRAAALAIAPSSIKLEELDEIADSLGVYVQRTRDHMRERGIGVLRS